MRKRCDHKGALSTCLLKAPWRLYILGIAIALMVSMPLEATVTPAWISSKTITLNRNSDFGASTTEVAVSQGTMTAIEIDPLGTMTGSINVPVSQIGNNATDTVNDDGTITKTLATSSTDYIWRATISGGSSTRTTERNYLLSNLQDTYAFGESLGDMQGYLSLTTNSSRKLSVTLVKNGALGSTTANPSYVWRNLNLVIDLKNVRYSGTYSGTLNSTLLCPPYIN